MGEHHCDIDFTPVGPKNRYEDTWYHYGCDAAYYGGGDQDASSSSEEEPEPKPHIGVVSLVHLLRLVVTDTSFLSHIDAPALQELQTHGSIEDVLPFISTSHCVLTHLTLFKCSTSPLRILAILKDTPKLVHLALDFLGPAEETAELVSALTVRTDADGPIYGPCLSSLSWGDRNDTIDRHAFVDMVESRCTVQVGCQRLRFVGVYLGRVRMKGAGLRLKALAGTGLEVVIMNAKKGKRLMEGWRQGGIGGFS
ncbi:hypothetical protein FB45DRAFT_872322 [Roridomyces roridus]|uniref:Uncharacterized protein n=1 Tax=Roridomyces roridus TaxID=1738132 RepID=A0AAD7BDD7_9AGAR|nr:hypothetical protein FB45DRAFT_872322 [Roridomyces roridus]